MRSHLTAPVRPRGRPCAEARTDGGHRHRNRALIRRIQRLAHRPRRDWTRPGLQPRRRPATRARTGGCESDTRRRSAIAPPTRAHISVARPRTRHRSRAGQCAGHQRGTRRRASLDNVNLQTTFTILNSGPNALPQFFEHGGTWSRLATDSRRLDRVGSGHSRGARHP